jgi:hypothetical protein
MVAAAALCASSIHAAPGDPIGPRIRVGDVPGACFGCWPALAVDERGGFVVAWEGLDGDGLGVQARAFDPGGQARGDAVGVNVFTSGAQRGPAVATVADGRFLVTWEDRGGQDGVSRSVRGRAFEASGTAVGGEVPISGAAGIEPAIAPGGTDGFVVVWESPGGSGSQILGRRFAETGAPLGEERAIGAATLGTNRFPHVASAEGQGFVVVWNDVRYPGARDFDVVGRRFADLGSPAGGVFPIATATAMELQPRVAMDPTGAFVALWEATDLTDLLGRMKARRYDVAAQPLGDEFSAAVTDVDQVHPAIAVDEEGRFVVAWAERSADGGVQARRFDRDGTPLGPAFRVDHEADTWQSYPSVGIRAGGDFVVVWRSDRAGGVGEDNEYRIFGQWFEGPTPRVPALIPITAHKLVVLDRLAVTGRAKTLFVSKDRHGGITKGSGRSPEGISLRLDLVHGSVRGAFVVPAGADDGASGWFVNDERQARYVNTLAPDGPTQVEAVVVEPGRHLKVIAAGLGDEPFGARALPAAPEDVTIAACIDDFGETACHCSVFSRCRVRQVGGDRGTKLVCRRGRGDPACRARSAGP